MHYAYVPNVRTSHGYLLIYSLQFNSHWYFEFSKSDIKCYMFTQKHLVNYINNINCQSLLNIIWIISAYTRLFNVLKAKLILNHLLISITNACALWTNNRLMEVFIEQFNQPAVRAIRVLRPLKLVTGFESKSKNTTPGYG